MIAVVRIILGALSVALCAVTLLPISTSNAWWIRAWDFPRLQLAVAIVGLLACYAVLWVYVGRQRWRGGSSKGLGEGDASGRVRGHTPKHCDKMLPALLLIALAWQCFRIYPYTLLAPVQMERAGERWGDDELSMVIFNVRYDNRDVDALLRLIETHDPDVVLLVEPTGWWEERLRPLLAAYPYTILQAQENHSGVLLYSRLELSDPVVRFLTDGEVPSVRAGIRMKSGELVRIYGLHPKPPGLKRPVDDEREDSNQRDAELIMVAREVDEYGSRPVIVAGDFNDVAWSHTSRLFQRISGLLDPRIGRGLFNTYKTGTVLTRFPLDHVYASNHFRLVELRVLRGIGSDHHPVMVTLRLEADAASSQEEPTPNPGDVEEAIDTIEEGS